MAVQFYREKESGDFLSIQTTMGTVVPDGRRKEICHEARATTISGHVGSLCSQGVCQTFLDLHCERVDWRDIPVEWLVHLHTPDGVPGPSEWPPELSN